MANKSYINLLMLNIVPNKKRKFHSEQMKDVKRIETNNEGYSKEIGSGVEEIGYGENDKDKCLWMKNLHQYLSGPDSMNPDMRNMPGNPHSTLPHFGNACYYRFIRQAVIETMKEKVRHALDRAKKEGLIKEDQDIFDVQIDIPGVGLVTYDQLTETLSEKALIILNKMIANKHKEKVKLEKTKTEPKSDLTMPEFEELTQTQGLQEKTKPEEDQSLADLNKALDSLNQVNAFLNNSLKTGKNKKLQFPISGETDNKHKKRRMVEQLSKDEEEEVEFYKTQYDPSQETKPYIQEGSGNENPEQAFAGTPMWNEVFMWMN